MGRITLVLGGTKSGKTSFAQNKAAKLAADLDKNILYIATARALDGGMKKRIAAHKASRPAEWITVEEPLHVSRILKSESAETSAVLLDCLTMLATNLLMELGDEPDRAEAQKMVIDEVEAILKEAEEIGPELIIISNQVEAGLVAPTRLGGIFQDIAGISHQLIASKADEVYLMTAGIPQKLKG